MIGKHRSAVRWLLGVMVALAVSGPSGAWIQPDRPERVQTQGPSWPQAASDVAADPEFRFGVLPNGMRYAVRRQAVPPGKAALRLHVSAGSLNEAEGQQGFAHFVEHMAFNGSTGVPEGEMIRILERLGLAFGPDTNASTGFDETLYRLDLPRTDRETLETGLQLDGGSGDGGLDDGGWPPTGLVVLPAGAEELDAHAALLGAIAKDARGPALWDRLAEA